jgi:regulator of replication initiation timing
MAERQRASRDESLDASVDALKEQIQRARSEIDALRQRVGGGQDERYVRASPPACVTYGWLIQSACLNPLRASASRELAETQEALAKEAERLRAELAAETAARTARDEKHARLLSEHDLLTKKAAQTSKAGDGMFQRRACV